MDQKEIFEKVVNTDKNSYSMVDIVRTLGIVIDGCTENTQAFKNVISKVSKGEWIGFINSLTISFIMSLHGLNLTPEEQIKFGHEVPGTKAFEVVIEKKPDGEA